MADLTKTVKVLFQGDDAISPSIKAIGRSVDKFGEDMSSIGDPFAEIAKGVVVLNLAIAGIAVAGLKASNDIDAAARKMQNSLGLTNAEAEKFKVIAADVYKSGITDDLVSAFDTVILAQKRFGDNAGVDIGKVAQQATILQNELGVELNESLGAASTLMKNFGLSSDEAFNFITAGFQRGLNGSGDFLESINEYSTQFANGGADAGQFFSVLDTGFQEGVLGTDKAADAFKEFRVRIQDESTRTRDSLRSIGIDPIEFEKNLASGKLSAIEAFGIITGKLRETKDESVKLNAGVGLIGTQFEDLGTRSALAIDTTSTKITDLQGKIDSLDPGDFGKAFQALINTVKYDLGQLQQWDDVKDNLGQLFKDIAENFGEALKGVDFSGLEDAVGRVWDVVADSFRRADLDLTTVEGLENAIQLVVDSIATIEDVTAGIVAGFTPVVLAIKDATEWVNKLTPEAKKLAGELIAFGSVVAVGGTLLTGIAAFVGLLSGPAGLAALVLGLSTVGFTALFKRLKEAEEGAKGVATSIEQLPEELSFKIDADTEGFDKYVADVNALPAVTTKTIKVEADTKPATQTVEVWVNGEKKVYEIPIGTSGIEDAKREIEAIPTQRLLELKLQGDIDIQIERIKAQASTVQKAVEWTAKIDIAEVEAAARNVTDAFESTTSAIESTGNVLSSSFGALTSASSYAQIIIKDYMEEELRLRKDAFALQEKLTEAQIKSMEERSEAYRRGDAIIKVESSGLEPALEMIWYKILEKTQIRTNEEGLDVLLGAI